MPTMEFTKIEHADITWYLILTYNHEEEVDWDFNLEFFGCIRRIVGNEYGCVHQKVPHPGTNSITNVFKMKLDFKAVLALHPKYIRILHNMIKSYDVKKQNSFRVYSQGENK